MRGSRGRVPNHERMSRNSLRSLARRVVPTLLVAQVVLLPLQSASAATLTAHPCGSAAGCGSVVVAPVSQAAPDHGDCTSPEPVVCLIRSETPQEREVARDQRMRYHGLIADMERTWCAMRAGGRTEGGRTSRASWWARTSAGGRARWTQARPDAARAGAWTTRSAWAPAGRGRPARAGAGRGGGAGDTPAPQ